MTILMTAVALAAAQAAPATPASNPHAQHAPGGQADHSKMDHSKMDRSKMGEHCAKCCKKAADGKMKCAMHSKAGSDSAHQGHSGQ